MVKIARGAATLERASTSASQAWGSTSLSLALTRRRLSSAARSAGTFLVEGAYFIVSRVSTSGVIDTWRMPWRG